MVRPKGLTSEVSAMWLNTILIVDDNTYIRQALCHVFKSEADFEVCGEATNGKEAIDKCSRTTEP
jgi:YesN/AraC family two-component response regulator